MDIIAIEKGGGKNFASEATCRCVRRVADSCHAILKITNDEVSTLAKPHNHPSDKTAVEIENVVKL